MIEATKGGGAARAALPSLRGLRAIWHLIPRPLRIILARVALIPMQLFGVLLVTFVLVRLLPGDPALLLLGNMATPDAIAALRQRLGLDQSVWIQFMHYLINVLHGDLGTSIFTSHPVTQDLLERAPATLELITYAMILTVVLGVGLAILSVAGRRYGFDRLTRLYGLAAGALPDFWVGLLLIFFFFHIAGWAPAPFGRLDTYLTPPNTITGFYTIDSLLTGNWADLGSAISRLALPVITISLVNAGAMMKMTQTVFANVYDSSFVQHARACGMPESRIVAMSLKNSMPPIITTAGFLFGFLLGAAVIVETIFSWGGLGQYAVQAVINSDYPALQGFVMVAAIVVLLVYLVVDVLYELVDPRIRI
ncbi:ABC transporter permease [Acidisoma cellulosilytica]|uniref:ABC transporter permease n=1 Tax=Acidisoma cellulosilyticum TaxID=2802395 RepID=A0A963Z2D3_9PROT|nr:ABC transporter permease [Acidisoma cellulosilyticum]MCB8881346.1 ABC transporter permease [Acidisoma cellulosilyticum]